MTSSACFLFILYPLSSELYRVRSVSTDRFPGKRLELAVDDGHLGILELAL